VNSRQRLASSLTHSDRQMRTTSWAAHTAHTAAISIPIYVHCHSIPFPTWSLFPVPGDSHGIPIPIGNPIFMVISSDCYCADYSAVTTTVLPYFRLTAVYKQIAALFVCDFVIFVLIYYKRRRVIRPLTGYFKRRSTFLPRFKL